MTMDDVTKAAMQAAGILPPGSFPALAEAEYLSQRGFPGYRPYGSGPEAWAHVKEAVDLYWEDARRSVESPWIAPSTLQDYLRRSLVRIAVASRRAAQESVLWLEPWSERVKEGLEAARAAWGKFDSCFEGRTTIASAHEGYALFARGMALISASMLDEGGENAGFLLCMMAVIAQAIAEDLGLCPSEPTEGPTR